MTRSNTTTPHCLTPQAPGQIQIMTSQKLVTELKKKKRHMEHTMMRMGAKATLLSLHIGCVDERVVI